MARKIVGTAAEAGGEDEVTLNPEQLAFVTWKGPAVLHAPVGTGKTLALAERAAQAILAGVQPSRILCLTFTNRAAEEMQERIFRRCGPEAREVVVRTFHGFGAWFLHVEGRKSGLPAEFLIFDEEDSISLLSTLLREHGVSADSLRSNRQPGADARSLYHWIQDAKIRAASGPVPAEGDPDEAWIKIMESMSAEGLNFRLGPLARWYHQALRNAHALNFADLILHTRWLLTADPKVRARWQDTFDLIQVDEMQDTHLAEYRIIETLGARHGNVALAGDFDQTIYEWRGSRPDEVLARFQGAFPGARTFEFRVNFRSTRRLLQLPTAVASTYSNKPPPRPVAHAVEGEPAEIHLARDEITEAKWIARQIQTLGRQGRIPLQRIGVLTRTNGRATTLSGAFVKLGIPHITVETFEFFRRQEVKDALAYLRFLLNRYDEQAFRRLLMRPARNIGRGTIAVIDGARRTGLRIGQDEVVELAAIRLEKGKRVDDFRRYLRNTVPVREAARHSRTHRRISGQTR